MIANATGQKIRVGIIERNHLFRNLIANIVRSRNDMEVAFLSSECDYQPSQADLIILPWDITRRILGSRTKEIAHSPRHLVINADPQEQGFADLIRCGANGFVPLNSTEKEIVDAILIVMETGSYLPAPIAKTIREELSDEMNRRTQPSFPTNVRITDREREIIRLIQDGLTNKEIALRLTIAVETVKSHVHRIMEKLGVRTRTALRRF